MRHGLSEPEFYGDLKIKNVGMTDKFGKVMIHVRYKRIGYNLNVMRQSACLVINPINTVSNFADFFNYTPADRASDIMLAPT